MSKASACYNFFKILGLVLLLSIPITLIVGCATVPSGVTSVTPTSQPEIDGSPKGPGSANLTATARATPVASICPNLQATSSLTNGWKTYRDTQYPFRFAYPPNWKPYYEDGEPNDHAIAIFPPNTTLPFTGYAAGSPEYLEVAFPLNANGAYTDPSQGAGVTQLVTMTVDSQRVRVYRIWGPECLNVDYVATGTFGHHDFEFHLSVAMRQGNSIDAAFTARVKQDAAYFLCMVESFVYTT
ncbi:MAG: hypothetical protein WCD86_23500 [Ktedonobacteraceae bacterium]